jgi:hypothetical protein
VKRAMLPIPEDIRKMLTDRGIMWVATSSKDGVPNVSPRSAFWITDDGALAWCDWFKHKTFWNWRENNHVAVSVVDTITFTGWQLKGKCEFVEDDEEVAEILQGVVSKPRHRLFTRTMELHEGYSPIIIKFTAEKIYSLAPEEASKEPLVTASIEQR